MAPLKLKKLTQPFSLVQLGTELIGLLIESAVIQQPFDQENGASFEVRPAFRHYYTKSSKADGYEFHNAFLCGVVLTVSSANLFTTFYASFYFLLCFFLDASK